jgi:hypothetical protein
MRGDDSVYGKLLSYIDRKKWVSADHPLRLIRRIANARQFGDPTAGGLLRPGSAPRRRSRGLKAENLLFLTVIGIVTAVSAGSLFTAAFGLLVESKTAMRPAALSAVPAQPVPAAGAAKPLSPASPAASPPPPTVRYAIAQGDTSFADGKVLVARFYYLQAVDAGDADAAVRIGETFDPAFLTLGRLRRVLANREAARFWYRRALDLGATQAKQRLDNLETEPAAGDYTDEDR